MFSKACQYGIKASVYIASQSSLGNRVSLKDIAFKINSPEAFTAKILHQLAKQNILTSLKGPRGGFEIQKGKAETISLRNIVAAIDGDAVYNSCALGFEACNARRPCSMHNEFVAIKDELRRMLENTSLFDMANRLEEGDSFLKH